MSLLIPYSTYKQKHRQKYAALYFAVKEGILSGSIPRGTKLPSSRELAEMYGISRGTVATAYDMLHAEGYVIRAVGKGTFVAFSPQRSSTAISADCEVPLSAWAKRAVALGQPERQRLKSEDGSLRFELGFPDLRPFPAAEWNRHQYAQVRLMSEELASESYAAQGHRTLREAIARHLQRTRGFETDADDIAIVNGSMQGIALLVQTLIDPGENVIVENPGHGGTRRAIVAAGGKPLACELDSEGIIINDEDARLLIVTPNRQFPTGSTMSLGRRQALIEWAERRRAIIIEDDYDSEFRHFGRPMEPLKWLDRHNRVVYIGTFSKTMLPHVRIGYLVLPSALRQPFLQAKRLYEPHPSSLLLQRALATFMNSGEYERHLRRMNRIYSRKYALLHQFLRERLHLLFAPVPTQAGLHLFAWWKKDEASFRRFQHTCEKGGVVWSDPTDYFAERFRPSACFGFSHLSEEEIEDGVKRMEAAAAECGLLSRG